jgi:hypothetical protein
MMDKGSSSARQSTTEIEYFISLVNPHHYCAGDKIEKNETNGA